MTARAQLWDVAVEQYGLFTVADGDALGIERAAVWMLASLGKVEQVASGGEGYVVHYVDLTEGEVGWWNQIRTVTLPVAIGQCIVTGLPGYLLRQATAVAADRGDLTPVQAQDLTARLAARDV
ncbi:MAG: hypothetical protein KJ792_07720 [Actinobacteria bacterium]|nr:hypothetical protein [Actinomycetota bacterium]MCG2803720.1 hypothetical protein [Cellulomonas sp.]